MCAYIKRCRKMYLLIKMYVARIFHMNGANILCFVLWAIQTNVSHTARASARTHIKCQTHSEYFRAFAKVFMIFMEILHKFVTFMALPFRVLSLTLILPIELLLLFLAHWFFPRPIYSVVMFVVCIVIFMSIIMNLYAV